MQEIPMIRLLLCLSFMTLVSVQRGDAQQPFTLEQVLSAPFPANLTASKSGERLAWTLDEQGHRNIWVAEGPGGAAINRLQRRRWRRTVAFAIHAGWRGHHLCARRRKERVGTVREPDEQSGGS